MKLLVAIMTAHVLDYYVDDCTQDWVTQQGWRKTDQQARVNTSRETWLKELPDGVDYKFFYGTKLRDLKPNQRTPDKVTLRPALSDEVYLDCGDGYRDNPEKMKAICRYALAQGYDFILRIDDDTFICPRRLLAADWAHDYAGSATEGTHPGACVFLSRRMMEFVVSDAISSYADDTWMGKVARDHQIPMTHIPQIYNPGGMKYRVDATMDLADYSAFHSCSPEVMQSLHVARR